jgi:hypothetical protein
LSINSIQQKEFKVIFVEKYFKIKDMNKRTLKASFMRHGKSFYEFTKKLLFCIDKKLYSMDGLKIVL